MMICIKYLLINLRYNNYIHESILLNFRAIRNNQKKNIILKNEG